MMPESTNRKIREEAELWFARLRDPSVCEQEGDAFELWRASDPRHAQAYAETERLWERLAILKQSQKLAALMTVPVLGVHGSEPPSARKEDETHVTRTPVRQRFVSDLQTELAETLRPAPQRRRKLVFALAASVLVATLGMMTYFLYHPAPGTQRFTTTLGEQRTETLEDGTTLRLNTSSTLGVRMTSSRRETLLEQGEAAFDVAKDVARPFVVSAGDGTITAVGTHFQVRHEGGQVTVTLMEGRLQLVRASLREFEWLDAGQQATFSRGASGIVRRNVDVKEMTSWMSGRLEFRDTPLGRAVQEANRYSARKIRVGDPIISDIPVSGTFRTGDVEAVAVAFEAAFPVRMEAAEEEIVLYSR